jgi:cation diffusion facilitator CzcD-associated flavoprotein CzcO
MRGTWYSNRYPGARVDTESLSYAYSWDKDLLNEWTWKESFSTQPDVLRYIQHVCDKYDLYKDICLNTRVKTACWQDKSKTWLLCDEIGALHQTRFFVSCMGFLSAPTLPAIPDIKSFRGKAFHTSQWPKNFDISRDLANKRVGVIGTGATGIQTITAVSKEPSIRPLTVFQRIANWSAPLRNKPISPEQMEHHRKDYEALFQLCAETPTCFMHQADPRKSLEVSAEERLKLWEDIYAKPGFAKWLGTFSDTYTNCEANKLYSDFMASKIRARIDDPEVADSLIPKDHGFGTRRVPLESGYFEAFNQPNVHLVDLKKTPIEKVTETGLVTSDGKEHELDVLIYATGFDAITGAFSSIEWEGKDSRPLLGSSKAKGDTQAIWLDHQPRTHLGMTACSMPNMFMVLGPHQPFGNAPRSIEHAVEVISDILQHCKVYNYSYVEPTEKAVDAWTEHVVECSKGALSNEADSWMTGVNTNVEGRRFGVLRGMLEMRWSIVGDVLSVGLMVGRVWHLLNSLSLRFDVNSLQEYMYILTLEPAFCLCSFCSIYTTFGSLGICEGRHEHLDWVIFNAIEPVDDILEATMQSGYHTSSMEHNRAII